MDDDLPIMEVQGIRRDTPSRERKNVCGYGACHPSSMQHFAKTKWFLVFMSMYVLLQSLLSSGYISSVITTIEKRYDLRSTQSGVIVSSFDIGSLLVVVFISYFGGKGHRPKWVGIGAIIVAIGAALFASPQLFSSPYKPEDHSSSSTEEKENLCSENNTINTMSRETQCDQKNPSSFYIFLFIVANMIIGIGSTPIYTLGTTFIYDNSLKENSSLYIATLYLMGAIGPALGYLLGGYLLNYYVDPGVTPLPLDDPRFIGAWWSGYVLCAALIVITSIPILGFPKQLPRQQLPAETRSDLHVADMETLSEEIGTRSTENDSMEAPMSFGDNIKDLPRSFLSLLKNPIFLCITASATLEFSIVTAFMTFVPKYLQNQFDIVPTQASILTGVVLIPSAGGGILLGGFVVKKFKMNLTGCAKVALLSNIIALSLFVSVFFVSCPSTDIKGLSSDSCPECHCDSTSYDPICFSSNVTYYNPCLAGCRHFTSNSNGTKIFPNCSCSGTLDSATAGACSRECTGYFIPFMIGLFFVTMATASAQTPALMVTLRCVNSDERPFAMGLQFVFFRALAYIPAPIYFGSAIDRACLIWNGGSSECEDGSGACLVYNSDQFRSIYFGLAFFLKLLAFIFVICTWYLCRKQQVSQTRSWGNDRLDEIRFRKEGINRAEGESYGSVKGRVTNHKSMSSGDSWSSLESASSQRPLMPNSSQQSNRKMRQSGKNPKRVETSMEQISLDDVDIFNAVAT